MTRRIIVGIVWAFVLYFAACTFTGGIVGFILEAQTPDADIKGAAARTVFALRPYFAVGAIAFAGIGAWKGWLPWAVSKKGPN
jgi:hypothetical protein